MCYNNTIRQKIPRFCVFFDKMQKKCVEQMAQRTFGVKGGVSSVFLGYAAMIACWLQRNGILVPQTCCFAGRQKVQLAPNMELREAKAFYLLTHVTRNRTRILQIGHGF